MHAVFGQQVGDGFQPIFHASRAEGHHGHSLKLRRPKNHRLKTKRCGRAGLTARHPKELLLEGLWLPWLDMNGMELVGGWALPLWKIWVRQLGWFSIPNIWKVIKFHGSNHQSININQSDQDLVALVARFCPTGWASNNPKPHTKTTLLQATAMVKFPPRKTPWRQYPSAHP